MAYVPQPFPGFGSGLNLRDQPDAVPGDEAIDLLNVTFTSRGAVAQRDGYAQFTGSELTNQPDSVFPHYESDGTKQLLVGNGNRVDALGTDGASAANVSQSASPHFFARFGGPTAEVTYLANGTNQVKAWNGTAFSSPAGLSGQTGKFLAVTPTSNRLVVARESGTTGGNNPSSVNFSDPGAPETFTANNYVDLDPGDGEVIMGVVAWESQVFVFKQTKLFAFYGEQVDQDGVVEFSYRKVDTGIGLAASRALCAGADGVYFLDRTGVYRTTGGAPELVSDKISEFFEGDTSQYYKSSPLNHGAITTAAAAWHNERLYLAVPTALSTNDRMLVFDPKHGWWSLYDIPASALTDFRIGSQPELVFAAPTGSNYVYRHSGSYVTDAASTTGSGGTAVAARWRSGWVDFGSTDMKTIREAKLWGSGDATYKVYADFSDWPQTTQDITLSSGGDLWGDGTDATDFWGDGSSSDLWGPAGTIRPALLRKAAKGTVFSIEFANDTVSRSFSIHRLAHHLRDQKIPSTIS